MVEPVTLGVIAAALVAKALDRAEDDAVDAGEGALRRCRAPFKMGMKRGSRAVHSGDDADGWGPWRWRGLW